MTEIPTLVAAPDITAPAPDTRGNGTPLKYEEGYVERCRVICELGASNKQLADALGISTSTLYDWQCTYPDFARAMKVGKDLPDELVVRGLFHRARGYQQVVEKVFCSEGVIVRATVIEEVAADPRSAEYWLNNRRPGEWKDKRFTEHSGGVTLSSLIEQSDNGPYPGAGGPAIEAPQE